MTVIYEYWWYFVGYVRQIFGRPYVAVRCDGRFPRKLAPQAVYVLEEDGDQWQATMICPCGCGAHLELNLLPDERPVWKLAIEKDESVTLHPSVWRKVGCKSHFFLRKGRISWCP